MFFFSPGVVDDVIHIFAESTSSANKKSLWLGILIRCFEIKYAPVYSYFLDLGYISCSNPSVIDSHKKSKFYFYFGPSFCPGSVNADFETKAEAVAQSTRMLRLFRKQNNTRQ